VRRRRRPLIDVLEARVITEIGELDPIWDEWDGLAVANGLPTMSPAWGLAWWKQFAPERSALRVVVVSDEDRIVGVAPFFVRTAGASVCDLLGEDTGRHAPLALPGSEWAVAEAASQALMATDPPPVLVRFMSAPLGAWYAPWVAALCSADDRRRARTILRRPSVTSCPGLELPGTFDSWFAGKSAHFRAEMRRIPKRFAAAGATIRCSEPATVEDDLRTYLALHLQRWRERGSLYDPIEAPLRAAFTEMARALGPGRFRLYVAELDGTPIAAQLFLAAGGCVMHHNGGWDEAHARLKPGLVSILHAIEQAFEHGDRRIDFGPGAYAYKLRFADGDEPVMSASVAVLGPDLAQFAARRALTRARSKLAERAGRR
jgi:CelD/BcsL family acetyltransferase involved in cellulose biosynthesis